MISLIPLDRLDGNLP